METHELRRSLRALQEQQERSLLSIVTFLEDLDQKPALHDTEPNGLSSTNPRATVASVASRFWTNPDVLKEQLESEMDVMRGGSVQTTTSARLRKGAGRSFLMKMANGSKFKDLLKESFDHIDGEVNWWNCSEMCRWILTRPQFDWFMGVIIFINSICIGIETQKSIPGAGPDWLPDWPGEIVDWIFISIYLVEICMRLLAFGRSNLHDGWFLFDIVLVGMGILGNIFGLIVASEGENAFGKILVVRSLRLLRLVRAIRMLHVFRTAWRLVYGLLTSGNAMLSTFFILLLTLYIFACLGVELITKDSELKTHPDTKEIVQYYFGSLQRTLLTMVSFVSSDSISSVYIPICIVRPEYILFFILVVLTVSVSLMNLVTAVLVEGALANAANDKELSRHDLKLKVKKFAPKIMDVFSDMDVDSNGVIDRQELAKLNLSQLPFELNSTHVANMEGLFDMLDVDGKGHLSLVEFADGLLNLLTMDVPIHTMKTFKLLNMQAVTLDQIKSRITLLEATFRTAPKETF
ncbi:Cation channel sperm-associated protein 1 (CatSper1) [Durusdinium trenchii]|uniref:Cation channel sperm-associated protein 1 (CatSper1) n=1 Tax=Durusdinium trenchii TaxID=1381693 RepID=A0ABP0HVH3_9DINO